MGCPYCKKVVTAPPSSTWPPGDIPQASPAGPAFAPPPPPGGQAQPVGHRTGGARLARRALILAVTCAVLSLLGYLGWFGQLASLALEKVGPNATQEEASRAWQEVADEIMDRGLVPTNRFSTATAIVGTLCGIGGLVFGSRSLMRQERRRAMAIAACIISACFLMCQMPMLVVGCNPEFPARAQPSATQPASTEPADGQPAPNGDDEAMTPPAAIRSSR